MKYDGNILLIIVGGVDPKLDTYFKELQELVVELDIEKNVLFTKRISKLKINTYYQYADVYLSLSEHEGFCVPILESQMIGVPVIAYKSSAVADTVGREQILLDSTEPLYVAAALHIVLSSERYAHYLSTQGSRNWKKYSHSLVRKSFLTSFS